MKYFENQTNGNIEMSTTRFSWLWCFLFGAFYFLFKRNWRHVFLYILFAVFTLGISMLIYPLFVRKINNAKYLRSGWMPIYEAFIGYELEDEDEFDETEFEEDKFVETEKDIDDYLIEILEESTTNSKDKNSSEQKPDIDYLKKQSAALFG